MNRRTLLAALGIALTSTKAFAESLDQWLKSPAMPGVGSTVPTQKWTHSAPAKVMRWACVCLRHGAHWTIGAINFAAASIGQVRHHLVSVHGHNYGELNGMSKEAMGNLHDAHHEGRSYGHYNFPATPANGVNHLRRRPT